ncbi:30S ribosomal protein S6 [candidate division FCPU426 bacterium]|nr:30S ribosomal protein S6 [candidate division FCPU426 bacterium]
MKTAYETMFLLPPTISTEAIDSFLGRIQDTVEKKHGEVTKLDKMGVRKTSYSVNKLNSAYYILLQYRGTGETIFELERMLKNSDEVLKYLSTKITTKPAVIPAKKAKNESRAAEIKQVAPAAVPSPEAALLNSTEKDNSPSVAEGNNQG